MQEPSGGDIGADIASCAASHAALVDHLRTIEPAVASTMSRLPGWTIGHVMTHIARNADSHISMLDGHVQYPLGTEGRTADIEAGSGRTWDELVADVETTNAALGARFADRDDWGGTAKTVTAERPMRQLPLLRQREVEVHRVDLGLGYEFDEMPADYVRRDLGLMTMLWKARQPMGMTPLPERALALAPSARLAWMMGRIEVDGLGDAGVF